MWAMSYLKPGLRNVSIKHAVQRIPQVLAHDDGTVDGQFEVGQRGTHQTDDLLHAVNLLAQEDVHGLQDSHLLQALLHLEGHVVWRQLLQHVGGHAVDDRLSGLSPSTSGVLGLDAEDGVQHGFSRFALVAEKQ